MYNVSNIFVNYFVVHVVYREMMYLLGVCNKVCIIKKRICFLFSGNLPQNKNEKHFHQFWNNLYISAIGAHFYLTFDHDLFGLLVVKLIGNNLFYNSKATQYYGTSYNAIMEVREKLITF